MKHTLTPEDLALAITAIRDAGENDSNDYLYGELHEIAVGRADTILQATLPDLFDIELDCIDDIDDDQRDALILAYKDGFWEPCHQAERRMLRDLLARCLFALHEDDFPQLREDIRQTLGTN